MDTPNPRSTLRCFSLHLSLIPRSWHSETTLLSDLTRILSRFRSLREVRERREDFKTAMAPSESQPGDPFSAMESSLPARSSASIEEQILAISPTALACRFFLFSTSLESALAFSSTDPLSSEPPRTLSTVTPSATQ